MALASVTTERNRLAEQYRLALDAALSGAHEEVLERAYSVGRETLSSGLGLLDAAAMHHEALLDALRQRHADAVASHIVEIADLVLLESLSPFEMSHRGFGEANAALRRLNATLEEEGRRIARALHDDATQLLVSLHLELESLVHDIPTAAERIRRLHELLEAIERQMRELSHELRPPVLDDFGLVPALEHLARGIAQRGKLSVKVVGTTEGRLAPTVETVVYRVVQEALHNVLRHAKAANATVELHRLDERIVCTVRDDGVGFDVAAMWEPGSSRGIGLTTIRERVQAIGGTLDMRSGCGAGTELRVAVPLGGRR